PLCDLAPFPADSSTLNAFRAAFDTFVTSEAQRLSAYQETPTAYDISDAEPFRACLERYATPFQGLSSEQRQLLSAWLPIFDGNEETRGSTFIADLQRIE